MAISSLMGVSTRALFAAYQQVHTVGNNIANASTEGYSRQQAIQTPSMTLRTGAGYIGTGVTISGVTRASNMFLQEKAQALKSVAAADHTTRSMLGQLEQVFRGGEAGLGHAATQVFSAFADLAINPSDLSARQAVLGRLEEFAALASSNGSQLQSLQDNVRSDIVGGVAEVNTLTGQIAILNREIQNAAVQGVLPNDLLDHRDMLVGRLAEQVDVQTYTMADGRMAVFAAAGQPLVLGGDTNELVVQRDPLDPTRSAVSVAMKGELTLLADHHIGGGKLGGLVKFQNEDLLGARNRLGQLVTAVATAMNDQQGFGIDLFNQPGAPLFDLPAPQALAAQGNALDAQGRPVSSMAVEVVDASELMASDYELLADPANAGRYVLTRLSDGLVRSGVQSGDLVDGLRISAGAVPPTAGERFLLRAVAHVPPSLTLALRDPKGLAAAGPMVATLAAANTGTMMVSSVDVVAAPAAPYAAISLRFTDDAGAYDVLDGLGGVLGSGVFQPGQPVEFDGLSVGLTGVPRQGDELRLAPISHPGSNNGNALSFSALADRMLVEGQVTGEAYASLFTQVGVRAQGANIAADSSGAASTAASAALAAEVGVNLDEEAARLIQFQQSYQAAAKVLQSAQTMIDTLLGLTR
jgi:flagellar hook-associated protein 1